MSKLLFKKRFTEKRQFLTFWGFHRDNAKADHSDTEVYFSNDVDILKSVYSLNYQFLNFPAY